MARRRGKRHASSSTGGPSEVSSAGGMLQKRQKTSGSEVHLAQSNEVHLSEEQQDRLGRYSSSVQWIIKVAQDRGSNACLALASSASVEVEDEALKARVLTTDGQHIILTIQGVWAPVAARVLSSLGEGRIGLLSGLGARLSSSGNDIVFEGGKFVVELWDVNRHESHGYLEVVKGQVVKAPAHRQEEEKSDDVSREAGPLEGEAQATCDTPELDPSSAQTDGPHLEASQPACSFRASESNLPTATVTPVRNTIQRASSASCTPAWLRTPALEADNDTRGGHPEGKSRRTTDTSSPFDERSASSSSSHSFPNAIRQLGPRLYVPISLLRCDDKALVNVIGLTTTDHCARRSLSGSRDWKITIGLVDVESSKDPHSVSISFNLFSAQEHGLPRCKPASVLLLRGTKVRAFNSCPQGNGYPGQFEWAFMDTSEADHRQALHCSENLTLSEAERKELKRQYGWYRKRNKGQLQPAKRKPTRSLITLSAVEKETFFDTTVEIVKVWSGSLPPQIYVTDYTSHPLFYLANDVCIGVLSREELAEQQEDCNDAGNGRVLPISLWDDQQEAINSVHIGMLVRLENVRPKIQPSGFLEGTMGGSSYGREEKLKVIVVQEKGVLNQFQNRKQEYIEEVALKRAEKMASSRVTPANEEQDEEGEDISSTVPTPSMPPPGQRPLAVVENCSAPTSHHTGNSFESNGSRQSQLLQDEYEQEEEEEAPTLLEESLSLLPCTPIEHLNSLTMEQLGEGSIYVCQGRVYDMQPSDLHNFVEVVCGLCKVKLPRDHAFCAKCAEEDGKDLTYRFNFAFLVESIDQANKEQRGASQPEPLRVPILVQGESAKQFLYGFLPKDVHNRPSTRERLRKRLLPLLGSKLLSLFHSSDSTTGQEEQKPLPFRFAVRGTVAKKTDGSLIKRFSMIYTRLERRDAAR